MTDQPTPDVFKQTSPLDDIGEVGPPIGQDTSKSFGADSGPTVLNTVADSFAPQGGGTGASALGTALQETGPAHITTPLDDIGDIAPSEVSATGAVARGAVRGTLPAAGALGAAGAGAELGGAAGSFIGPWGTLAGGVIGGVGGALAGGAAVDAAQTWMLSKLPDSFVDAFGQGDRQQRLDQQERPVASFVGGMIPFALTMTPGVPLKALSSFPTNATALQQLLMNPTTARMFASGGVVGGMELLNEAGHGEVDWRKVAISTGFGVVFNKPTRLGEAINEIGAGRARPLADRIRKEPTIAQAADTKVMGPGITEAVFQGTHEQAPEAAMTAQETARAERDALGDHPEPNPVDIARQMEPELFARYDELQNRQKVFGAQTGPGGEEIPALDSHLASTNAELEKMGPEIAAAYRRAADTMNVETVEPPQFKSFAEMIAAREAGSDAKPPIAAGQTPPVSDGNVRFYHGGHDPTSGGGRWVTTDPEYARLFRATEESPKEVHYVDIPKGDETEVAARRWDDFDEAQGVNNVGTYRHIEVPEKWAKQMRPFQKSGAPSIPEGGEAGAAVPGQPGTVAAGAPSPERAIGTQRAFIADDVAGRLIAAGQPEAEARANGQLVAARYVTRAGRFEGKLGSAEDLYAKDSAAIAGPDGRALAPGAAPAEAPPSPASLKAADRIMAELKAKGGPIAGPEQVARTEIQGLLDRGATTSEISSHPFVKAALDENRARDQTKDLPGYGTPEFQANREFDFNGEKVRGYPAAINRLVDVARGFSTKGPVKNEREATIVLGPPAAGKSRLSETFARERNAAIVDSDEAKKVIPEYENGRGTAAVHEESSDLTFGPDSVLEKLASEGANIVLPKVGHSPGSIRKIISGLKDLGYKINLVNMNVAPDEAYRRMVGRFLKTGRIIGSDYFGEVGDKPTKTYYTLKDEGGLHEVADIDVNGPIGHEKFLDGADNSLAQNIRSGRSREPADSRNAEASQREAEAEVNHAEPVAAALSARDKIDELSPAEQKKQLPTYTAAAEQAPQGRDQPAGVFMFDPTKLEVDASRFQFKSGGDEYGVTGALRSVQKWDPAKAQSIIVWEQNDGKLFVADGHQRSGLAKRLVEQGKAKDVQLPGVLYREKDGVTSDDIRAIAAVTNIANGSGKAIDGAKVLRERPDLLDESLPLSAGKGKQAAALARLGDEAFRMVVNDVVPEHYGAVVGDLLPKDPERQVAALKAIVRFEPKNADEAAVLTQRVAQAELAKKEEGSQTSMFGDLETPESTAGEEMKIVGRAIGDLKKDKVLFARVLRNAERIEKTGSTIEREAAQNVSNDAEVFAKTLTSEAYSSGPVRTVLVAAARDLKSGKASIGEATDRILAALRKQTEANGADRPGAIGAGAKEREFAQNDLFEAGAEGKPQGLIPGVEPVSARDRIQALANKPLQGGNKPPPENGLFGSTKDQQELFQVMRGKIKLGSGRPLISLLKDANASTFVHETGHEFLEQMVKDAAHGDAPQIVREDMDATLKWMGLEKAEDLRAVTAAGKLTAKATKAHEKFARGFEQYMREGVAPSKELAGVFAQFRNWLLSLYQSLKGLGPEISPEIRGVFDRMLELEPQRTVIAPERLQPDMLHDIHEAEAVHTTPHEAEPAMDRIIAERDRYISEQPPEIQRELEAAAQKVQAAEGPAGEAAGAPGEAFASPGGQGQVGEGGGGPGAEPGGGAGGAEHGAEQPRGGNAGAEGNTRPDNRSELGRDPGTALAPGPVDLFGEQSKFTDKAGNIRLDTLNTTDDIRQAIRESAARNNNFIGDQNGPVTPGQVLDLAHEIGMDGAQKLVEKHIAGQAFNASEIVATRLLLRQRAAEVSMAAKKAADTGVEADILAYAQAREGLRMVQATVAGITAEAGRALRAFRKLPGEAETGALEQMVREATGQTLFQLEQEAKLAAQLDTSAKINKLMQEKRSAGGMLLEVWINGLLSAFSTQATNLVSNTVFMVQHFGPERLVAGMIGGAARAAGREGPHVTVGEIGAIAKGAKEGLAPALQATGTAYRKGASSLLPGEEDVHGGLLEGAVHDDLVPRGTLDESTTWHDVASGAFGAVRGTLDAIVAGGALVKAGGARGSPIWDVKYTPGGQVPDFALKGIPIPVGSLVRSPGRFLSTMDTFFRSLNYTMSKSAIAYRTATDEGLTGTAFAARVADIRNNPTPEVMEAARGEASSTTFMDKGGELVRWLNKGVNMEMTLPGGGTVKPGKFILPFTNVISRVLDQALVKRTPLGLAFSPELRADLIGKNGNVAQETAAARMLLGSTMMLGFGSLAAQGYVTGSGPKDPGEKAIWMLTHQPHSIKIGGIWYDMGKLGPLGMLMSVSADLHDIERIASEDDFAKAGSFAMNAFVQNIIDQSVLQGPAEIIKAVETPDQYGPQFVKSFLSSFVPNALNNYAKVRDPYIRQTWGVLDEIKSKLPGYRNELHPKIDLWGQPVPTRDALGGTGVTAIYMQKVSTDPVNIAMADLGMKMSPVEKKIRNIQLTPEEYEDFARTSGIITKDSLNRMVNSPVWETWPRGARQDAIKHVIDASREAAMGIMFGRYRHIPRDAALQKLEWKTTGKK